MIIDKLRPTNATKFSSKTSPMFGECYTKDLKSTKKKAPIHSITHCQVHIDALYHMYESQETC